jgi:hypothetical protein
MERRNLLGILAGTAAGFVLANKANAGIPEKKSSSHIIFASQAGAKLNSNVFTGGGTDDTEAIQKILDKAPEIGTLHLVMDGAALVRGLNIHSNTTIECLNSSCGFFLAVQSNRSVIQNANPTVSGERKDKNIMLLGGTYNQNCKNQLHHVKGQDFLGNVGENNEKWVIAMEFYGVENFTMRDVTIRDQRTFAMLMANWFRVTMENISIDLPGHMDAQNQDGLHFFGPGRFLTMRNIQGSSGDDFLALAPDEFDGISDITDVLIDGVFLNNADQGIRLLSREKGRLDRVIIKNITGTYKSFGFYIDPWVKGSGGSFGNIVFDTINLSQNAPNYDYTTPFLFRLGGKIESLTLKNIQHHNPSDARSLVDVGWPTPDRHHDTSNTHIKSLVIDGLHIFELYDRSTNTSFINVVAKVDNLVVRNVEILRPSNSVSKGCLIETRNTASIGTLFMNNICINGINSLLHHKANDIGTIQLCNVLASEIGEALICIENAGIDVINAGEVFGAKLLKTSGSSRIGKISGNFEKTNTTDIQTIGNVRE